MKFKRRSKLWIIVTVVLSAGIIAYDILVPKTRIFAVLGGLFIAYSIYQFFSLERNLTNNWLVFSVAVPSRLRLLKSMRKV